MRTLLAALALLAPLMTGCLCGGFDGKDDTVMRTARGDSMILCGNTGYSVMMADGKLLEGMVTHGAGSELTGTDGATGAIAFRMTPSGDGSMGSPQIGTGWLTVNLDKVELDHAHVQCTDLEMREWFAPAAP